MGETGLKTYLLTWTPSKSRWDSFAQDVKTLKSGRGIAVKRWSCGNTRSIPKGARFYFLRQGQDYLRGDPELLRPMLAHAMVRYRRRAIEVVGVRGPDCLGLLTDLASMLTKPQPLDHRLVFGGEGLRSTAVDITDEIQRLCATAILRVAPTGHPLLAAARERLNLPPAK